MSEQTQSSSNPEPQLLLESGAMLIRDFNPKGVLYWTGRKCISCGGEILDHWLRDAVDPDMKGLYWCSKEGIEWSEGITDCRYDVEGVSVPQDKA